MDGELLQSPYAHEHRQPRLTAAGVTRRDSLSPSRADQSVAHSGRAFLVQQPYATVTLEVTLDPERCRR